MSAQALNDLVRGLGVSLEVGELVDHVQTCEQGCRFEVEGVEYCPEAKRLAFDALGPMWRVMVAAFEPTRPKT